MLSDLAKALREHATRVAGGGPDSADYDPETLVLENDAADRIEQLEAEVARLREVNAEEDAPATQADWEALRANQNFDWRIWEPVAKARGWKPN